MRKNSEQSNKRTNQLINGLIIFGLSLLLFLILVGVFGNAGQYVSNFFIGVFGYAIYGYAVAGILISILLMIGWSANAKLGVKLAFGALIAIVIAMCHIGASRELAGLAYGEYLKQCYLTHSTAGGILGGIFFYPLSKVFLFSMIFLGLFVIGLVALLIIMHLNYELIVPTKANKVTVFEKNKKNKKNNIYESEFIQNDDFSNQINQESHVLYNGTVTGKSLPDSFSKGKNNDVLEYTPVENLGVIEKEEIVLDDSVKTKKDNSRDNLSQIQQEAIKVLYDNTNISYDLPKNRNVDVTNTLNHIKKNKKVENKSIDDKKDENIENITSIENINKSDEKDIILEDKYKAYTNNFRKNQVLENMGVVNTEKENEEISNSNNISDEEFLNNFQESLNTVLNNVDDKNNILDDLNIKNVTEDNVDDILNKDNFDKQVIDNSNYNQVNLDEIDKPRDENKYKIDEEKIRQDRLNQLKGSSINHELPIRENKKENKLNINSLNNNINEDSHNVVKSLKKDENKVEATTIELKHKRTIKPYIKPSINCLEDRNNEGSYDESKMKERCDLFESKMADAGIDIEVTGVIKGPAFSRIEFTTNTTLSKIIAHTKDIAMWLSVKSMRLEAPIPGRNCCGIEIPNDTRGIVGLKEIIESEEFKNKDNEGLYFALGKDIEGKCYVSDITEFPHGLIAGATKSGKSVCLNCMICSMLYKYSPEELRFILVDPKIVELNVYKDIPHLLIPEILNDEKKVIKALKWLCVEMERRYELLKDEGVANLEQFNRVVEQEDKMANIVAIIDEVGDIMTSSVKKEFEQLVKKLAQKARAAGIYLILATQRPSVDVITGPIKANLPARIAFAVASNVDSKTILDKVGAEKLLGKGDMLFKDPNKQNLVRLQGAFIDIVEIKKIVKEVKQNNEAYYDTAAFDAINKEDEPEQTNEIEKDTQQSAYPDELCPDVLRMALSDREFSASKLQRKFNIGFNRAARIADWMKDSGYLEENGNKKRFILSEEEVEEIIFNAENNNNND